MNEVVFRFLFSASHVHPFFDALIIFGASVLGWVLIALLLGFLWRSRKTPRIKEEIRTIVISVFAAWALAYLIKFLSHSPRPFLALKDVESLFITGGNDSFPSAHAAFYSALSVAVYFYNRKLAYALLIGAVIIGISRVAAGVHWPLDIVGGFLLGGGVAFAVYRFFENRKKPLSGGLDKTEA